MLAFSICDKSYVFPDFNPITLGRSTYLALFSITLARSPVLSSTSVPTGYKMTLITEGRGAANVQDCYVSQVYKWWYEAFPYAQINVINAGVGGQSETM